MQTLDNWIITAIATSIIGFVSYFLKQTMGRVNNVESNVQDIKDSYVKANEYDRDLDKLEKQIVQIREDYTPKKDHEKAYDELRGDISDIKENFLRKDDFLREMSKLDQKMDRVQELLMSLGGK